MMTVKKTGHGEFAQTQANGARRQQGNFEAHVPYARRVVVLKLITRIVNIVKTHETCSKGVQAYVL